MSTQTPTVRPAPAAAPRRPGMTRIVIGVLVACIGLATLAGGVIGVTMYDQRDDDGYYMTGQRTFQTEGHAIVSADETSGMGPDVLYARDMVGPARITGSSGNPDKALFVGIGPADDVAAYLDGVDYSEMVDLNVYPFVVEYDEHSGGTPATAPGDQDFWLAAESGSGPLVLETELPAGRWQAVVMNADGSEAVEADLAIGATLPIVAWSTILGFVLGALFLAGGAALVGSGVRAGRSHWA